MGVACVGRQFSKVKEAKWLAKWIFKVNIIVSNDIPVNGIDGALGGKAFGAMKKQQETALDDTNKVWFS